MFTFGYMSTKIYKITNVRFQVKKGLFSNILNSNCNKFSKIYDYFLGPNNGTKCL